MRLADLVTVLEAIAPLVHAEPWDNVGLLAGDPSSTIVRALLTIDCTRDVAEEARRRGCQAIVAYHPPIFAPLKRIAHDGVVAFAIRHGIALYSPHTALDAAKGGTNDVLADLVGIEARRPIRSSASADDLGMGRIGTIAEADRGALVERVRLGLGLDHLLVAGPRTGSARRVAVAAGAAGDLLEAAVRQGVDVVVTGEVRHHDALGAAESGVTVVCTLHSRSERLALAAYRARIAQGTPGVEVLESEADRDPFSIV